MTVYIDVIFLINFIMNMLVFSLTSVISKEKFKVVRILLSSLAGSLYSVLVFFENLKFLFYLPVKMLVSALLVLICFGFKKTERLIRLTVNFYISGFIFGGTAYFTLNFLNKYPDIVMFDNITICLDLKYGKIFLICLIVYFTVKRAICTYREKSIREVTFTYAEIYFNNESVKIKVLIDTGNTLKEPILNYPVIIVRSEAIRDILPCGLYDEFLKCSKDISVLEKSQFKTFIKLIPYNSLGNENGIMAGFIPQKIVIEGNTVTKAVVGVYCGKLSQNEDFEGIVSAEFLKTYTII